jgi:hypothetical protein
LVSPILQNNHQCRWDNPLYSVALPNTVYFEMYLSSESSTLLGTNTEYKGLSPAILADFFTQINRNLALTDQHSEFLCQLKSGTRIAKKSTRLVYLSRIKMASHM